MEEPTPAPVQEEPAPKPIHVPPKPKEVEPIKVRGEVAEQETAVESQESAEENGEADDSSKVRSITAVFFLEFTFKINFQMDSAEPRNRKSKSRWGTVSEASEAPEAPMQEDDPENKSSVEEADARGEKRRRTTSKSPERVVKHRQKSPAKEDEPELNAEAVQLSWGEFELYIFSAVFVFLTFLACSHAFFSHKFACM